MTTGQVIAIIVAILAAEWLRYFIEKGASKHDKQQLLTQVDLHNERSFKVYFDTFERVQRNYSDYKATQCFRNRACRLTEEAFIKEKCAAIEERETPQEDAEPEECTPDDCDTCDPKDNLCEEEVGQDSSHCPQCGSIGTNKHCDVCCDNYEAWKLNCNDKNAVRGMLLTREHGNAQKLDCYVETDLSEINRKTITINYQLSPNATEIIKTGHGEVTRIDISDRLAKIANHVEVKQTNLEAAESVKGGLPSTYRTTFPLVENPSHAEALGRCTTAKEATGKIDG